MSDVIKYHKVVAALPSTLDPNSVYYVRVGTGFDLYVTNDAGLVAAYQLNPDPKTVSALTVSANITLLNSMHGFVLNVVGDAPVSVSFDPANLIPGFRITLVRGGSGTVTLEPTGGTVSSLTSHGDLIRLLEDGSPRLMEDGSPRLVAASGPMMLDQKEVVHLITVSDSITVINFPDRAELLRSYVDEQLADLQSQIEAISTEVGQVSTNFRYTEVDNVQGSNVAANGYSWTWGQALPSATSDVSTLLSQIASNCVTTAGWINMTLINGWTSTADRRAQYKRVGNTVHIRGNISVTSTTNNTAFWTMPANYRNTAIAWVTTNPGGVFGVSAGASIRTTAGENTLIGFDVNTSASVNTVISLDGFFYEVA